MNRTCYVKSIPVTQYTLNPEIFSIKYKQIGRDKRWIINETDYYDADEWQLTDAIKDWLTPEARLERDLSWRRAWGFYD